jgi:hypothetical protein
MINFSFEPCRTPGGRDRSAVTAQRARQANVDESEAFQPSGDKKGRAASELGNAKSETRKAAATRAERSGWEPRTSFRAAGAKPEWPLAKGSHLDNPSGFPPSAGAATP